MNPTGSNRGRLFPLSFNRIFHKIWICEAMIYLMIDLYCSIIIPILSGEYPIEHNNLSESIQIQKRRKERERCDRLASTRQHTENKTTKATKEQPQLRDFKKGKHKIALGETCLWILIRSIALPSPTPSCVCSVGKCRQNLPHRRAAAAARPY